MAQFSKLLAARLAQQPQPGSHPDADTLTAFTENRLKSPESKSILTHLAACPDCREIVSLVSTTDVPVRDNAKLRWATAAALACTCLLVFTVTRHRPQPEIQTPSVVAITESPAPPAPIPSPIPAPKKATKKIFVPLVVPHIAPSIAPPPPVPPAAQIAELQAEANLSSTPADSVSPINLPAPPQQPPSAVIRTMLPQSSRISAFARPAAAKIAARKRQSLWSIQPGSGGTLSRSDDGGQTWISVGKTGILSLAVTQGDIWAGSDAGVLFHSTNNGLTWQQIIVSPQLTDPILSITHTGPQIRLKTKSADWVSSDDGLLWHPEPTR
jgi:hypothetical protein